MGNSEWLWENFDRSSTLSPRGGCLTIAAPPAQVRRSHKNRQRAGVVALFVALGVAMVALIFAMQNWTSLAKARKLRNPFPPTSDSLAAGMQAYRNHCQSCHGKYGDGKGEKASELSVAPGDFTDVSKMNSLTDGELYWQITKGRRPMPAFADKLDEQQRWQAVDYIRTFAQKPGTSGSPTPATGPPQP